MRDLELKSKKEKKMKVFYSGGAVNLSCIESMNVSDLNVTIIVRYQTHSGVRTNHITFRKPLTFDPHRAMTQELAEALIEEIESLKQQPNRPIEEVIDLKAWRFGCLGVDLNTATEAQRTHALARLCWNWKFGRLNAPTDKQLTNRTRLDTDTIKCITGTDAYKQCVKDLMRNDSLYEPRTPEEFRAWVKNYGNMPKRFGERMRLSEDVVKMLVRSLANELEIHLDVSWI